MAYTAVMDTLGERVRSEREAKGWSQAQLAAEVARAGFKITQAGISNIENRGQTSPQSLPEVASALGVTVKWLRTGRGSKTSAHEPADGLDGADSGANAALAPDAPSLPFRGDMPRDVPVFGTSQGGDATAGDFELNGQIVDFVRRPPKLYGRTDVFAIYVQGTSMSPWRESGELAYVERNRPARTGDYVVVEFAADAHNVRPALIKKLAALTPTKIKLQQYQPAKLIEIDRKKPLQIYRVIDWMELLGV